MSGLFGEKVPAAVTPVNPADTQNRINSALSARLQQGGSNSTLLSSYAQGAAATGAGKAPTLTGLS